jgi:plasmid maintenance system killer protein
MDLITQQVFSQGKVDCINKSAWEIIKRISSSLEVIDDDSNNDLFYTPPSNPLELIFIELENCLSVFIMVGGIHVFFYIII